MAHIPRNVHLTRPAGVGIDQTRARAGSLLEQGSAFERLEGVALAAGTAAPSAADRDAVRVDVVVIGAGQAGLSVGRQLASRGIDFVILESQARVGDSWRRRWDSLRLFTPARYDGLDGMRFPAPPYHFPTKDEMANFLETYAARFHLPVRTGVRVDAVTRGQLEGYVIDAGAVRYVARHVVIAAASYQQPRIPAFAAELDATILQLHASSYRNPAQLRPGAVLLVGAGNSGAEIALDLSRTHDVWLSGRHPGHLPVAHDGAFACRVVVPIVFRLVFHRLLSMDTPMGRKARPRFTEHSGPLIRVKPCDLDRAGVHRVPRLAGIRDGQPLLEDGRCQEVANVVWCTGFLPGLEWIRLPIFDGSGRPKQYRGMVPGEPGLYFTGLAFQHSASSAMIHGVGRDARRVVEAIVQRLQATSVSARA